MACWSPGNQLLSYPAQATHPPGISASSSTPSLCSSSPPPAGNAFRSSELHLLFLLTGSVQTYRSQLMQRVEYSVVIAGTDHEFPSAGSRRSPIPPLPLLPIEHLNLIHGHDFCFCSGKTMKWHIHAYNGIVRGRETKRHWRFVRREAGGEVAGHGVLAC